MFFPQILTSPQGMLDQVWNDFHGLLLSAGNIVHR